jgi:hypothetical protein
MLEAGLLREVVEHGCGDVRSRTMHERPVDRVMREREQLRPLVGSPFV